MLRDDILKLGSKRRILSEIRFHVPITYPGTTADGEAANAFTKKLVSI